VTEDREERLVLAWEALAAGLGALNEIARTAISKQWPDPREPREAVVTRLPTEEDKIKEKSGNTDIPLGEWLGEFDPEEEIGPREREFLAAQSKRSKRASRTKATT